MKVKDVLLADVVTRSAVSNMTLRLTCFLLRLYPLISQVIECSVGAHFDRVPHNKTKVFKTANHRKGQCHKEPLRTGSK